MRAILRKGFFSIYEILYFMNEAELDSILESYK